MKAICDFSELKRGVAVVGKSVPKNSALPVMESVKIRFEAGKGIYLSGSDLDLTITYFVPGQVDESRAVLCNYALLNGFIKTLKLEGNITMEIVDDKLRVDVPDEEAELAVSPPEDYPITSEWPDGTGVSLTVSELKTAIDMVAFAAAKELSRPVLTGVHCRFTPHSAMLSAVDGFRLSRYEFAAAMPGGDDSAIEVIIPARAMTVLASYLKGTESTAVAVTIAKDNIIIFRCGGLELVSTLVLGRFPDVSEIIPKQDAAQLELELPAPDLLEIVRTSGVFAEYGANLLRMAIKKDGNRGQLTVTSDTGDLAGSHRGEMGVTLRRDNDGKPMDVAFNARFLADVLKAAGTSVVNIFLANPSQPGMVTVQDENTFLHVLMPMHLSR